MALVPPGAGLFVTYRDGLSKELKPDGGLVVGDIGNVRKVTLETPKGLGATMTIRSADVVRCPDGSRKKRDLARGMGYRQACKGHG